MTTLAAISRIAAALLLVGLGLAAAGCNETPSAGGSDQPSATTTTPATTEQAPTTAPELAGGGLAAGEEVFRTAGCAQCHTLAAVGPAGSQPPVGPNLDDARPSFDQVVERVTNGAGVMPSFASVLSEQEIKAVAAFVSESAGQ